MWRVRVERGLLVYNPSAKCREILEVILSLGIGRGVEVDCVMWSSRVIGVELRYDCIYGETFRRVMSRPHPGGLLSINLESLRRKYLELLRIKEMYMEAMKKDRSPLPFFNPEGERR